MYFSYRMITIDVSRKKLNLYKCLTDSYMFSKQIYENKVTQEPHFCWYIFQIILKCSNLRSVTLKMISQSVSAWTKISGFLDLHQRTTQSKTITYKAEELENLQTGLSRHGVLQGGCVCPPLSPVSAVQNRMILNKHPYSPPLNLSSHEEGFVDLPQQNSG